MRTCSYFQALRRGAGKVAWETPAQHAPCSALEEGLRSLFEPQAEQVGAMSRAGIEHASCRDKGLHNVPPGSQAAILVASRVWGCPLMGQHVALKPRLSSEASPLQLTLSAVSTSMSPPQGSNPWTPRLPPRHRLSGVLHFSVLALRTIVISHVCHFSLLVLFAGPQVPTGQGQCRLYRCGPSVQHTGGAQKMLVAWTAAGRHASPGPHCLAHTQRRRQWLCQTLCVILVFLPGFAASKPLLWGARARGSAWEARLGTLRLGITKGTNGQSTGRLSPPHTGKMNATEDCPGES